MEVLKGGVTAPLGFRAAGIHCGVKKAKKDLALVFSDAPAVTAALFTRNAVPAAPVIVDREQLRLSTVMRAIIVNSGNANACTGERGMQDAWAMVRTTAGLLGIAENEVLVSSTGVIGQYLPIETVTAGIRRIVQHLGTDGHAAAEAIRTTDTFTKEICGIVFPRGHDGHDRGDGQGFGNDRPQHGNHAGICYDRRPHRTGRSPDRNADGG